MYTIYIYIERERGRDVCIMFSNVIIALLSSYKARLASWEEATESREQDRSGGGLGFRVMLCSGYIILGIRTYYLGVCLGNPRFAGFATK